MKPIHNLNTLTCNKQIYKYKMSANMNDNESSSSDCCDTNNNPMEWNENEDCDSIHEFVDPSIPVCEKDDATTSSNITSTDEVGNGVATTMPTFERKKKNSSSSSSSSSSSLFSFKGIKKFLGISSKKKKESSSQNIDYAGDDVMNASVFSSVMDSATTKKQTPPLNGVRYTHGYYYPKRIHTADWDTKPACAVVVTIYNSSSYDQLFRAVVQQSPDPESSIALFEMDYATIPIFLEYFRLNGDVSGDGSESQIAQSKAIKQVMDAIAQVSPNSVVFNFECCGHCNDEGFGTCHPTLNLPENGGRCVMHFMKALLDAGFMVMVGDFSLKALIHDWDASLLGPNPFDRVGTCESSIKIAFDSQQLLSCPSGQLQNVGKLNDGISTADIHCLSSTITCTLKDESIYTQGNDFYDLEVLTVATNVDGRTLSDASISPVRHRKVKGNAKKTSSSGGGGWLSALTCSNDTTEDANNSNEENYAIDQSADEYENDNIATSRSHRLLKIGDYKGYLGHALLKYRSGGLLLVSTCHWIELSKLDAASEERVLTAIREQYGEEYRAQLNQEFDSYGNDTVKKKEAIYRTTRQLIQSSTPCTYSKRGSY